MGKAFFEHRVHGILNRMVLLLYSEVRLQGLYCRPQRHKTKLNMHKAFRRRPGRLLNVLCMFNFRPVSTGVVLWAFIVLSDLKIFISDGTSLSLCMFFVQTLCLFVGQKSYAFIWEISFHPSLLYFSRVFVLILKFLLWQIVHNPDETYGACLCTRNLSVVDANAFVFQYYLLKEFR